MAPQLMKRYRKGKKKRKSVKSSPSQLKEHSVHEGRQRRLTRSSSDDGEGEREAYSGFGSQSSVSSYGQGVRGLLQRRGAPVLDVDERSAEDETLAVAKSKGGLMQGPMRPQSRAEGRVRD